MKREETKQIRAMEDIGDILLLPSTLRELERNILVNLCLAQQPLTTADVKKMKGNAFFQIKGAYNTLDLALTRLERDGYVIKKKEGVGLKKKRAYEFWYVDPYFFQKWHKTRAEIMHEVAKTPKELRQELYPASTFLFFGIHITAKNAGVTR